tara:strand:- start:106 stop:318 length:213 start_codon:yes stop_codon:yes gene_type:complete
MIRYHILKGQSVKIATVSDYRMSPGVMLEKSPKEEFTRYRVGIVFAHIDLSPYDISLCFEIAGWKTRLED